LDLQQQMIPVVPAAHYMCGGIATDLTGKTSVINLYACGEVSCTGVHGANRLASNSLLEGLVFAEEAAKSAYENLDKIALNETIIDYPHPGKLQDHTEIEHKIKYLQELMWQHAGIIREGAGLEYCLKELYKMQDFVSNNILNAGFTVRKMELQNMIECSIMVTHSALLRKESRGCHYRTDFPEKNFKAANTFLTPQTFDLIGTV